MDKFEIKGENGTINIQLSNVIGFPETTSYFGGYDTESIIEIRSSCYVVKGKVWITTGNIFDFYQSLNKCQENLTGAARLDSYEENLQLIVNYDELGHVSIKGRFIENFMENNKLEFELNCDQTFMNSTLNELEKNFKKYGDNSGIKT